MKNTEVLLSVNGSNPVKVTIAVSKRQLEGLQSLVSKDKSKVELAELKGQEEELAKLKARQLDKFKELVEPVLKETFGQFVDSVKVSSALSTFNGQVEWFEFSYTETEQLDIVEG